MSKIAGIKNKSPETYPSPPAKSNVLQTLSKVNAPPGGPVAIVNGSFTSLLGGAGPISFTPAVSGAYATIMVSGVLENASPTAGQTTVAIFLDTFNQYQIQPEVKTAGAPVPFSLVFETANLGVAGPHMVDVQAQAASGTSSAIDVSVVVIVTSD